LAEIRSHKAQDGRPATKKKGTSTVPACVLGCSLRAFGVFRTGPVYVAGGYLGLVDGPGPGGAGWVQPGVWPSALLRPGSGAVSLPLAAGKGRPGKPCPGAGPTSLTSVLV